MLRARQLLTPQFIDLWRQWPWIYPRGIEPSAQQWIRQSQQKRGWYDGLRSDWYEEIHPEGVLINAPPGELPEKAAGPFREVASRRYPAAFVCHFSGAHLFSNEGMVLTGDNRVLGEYHHQFNIRSLRKALRGRPFGLVSTHVQRVAESVGLLAAPQGWNYYHWLFDVLPRLHLLERWRGVIEKYAVPENLSAVQVESLRLLGIEESRLLRLQAGARLRCEHLYAPSLPGSEGCSPPWALKFLREKFPALAIATPGSGPLVYVRRGPGGARPIANEPELIARLEQRGFRAVSLETHGFLEQVAIFRDARCVVAAHGAGLANLAFAREAAVLELFSADYLRPDCYFTLQRQAGNAYDYWLDGRSAGPGKPWGEMTADLPAIEKKIDELLHSGGQH
jgi:hypothetical protein